MNEKVTAQLLPEPACYVTKPLHWELFSEPQATRRHLEVCEEPCVSKLFLIIYPPTVTSRFLSPRARLAEVHCHLWKGLVSALSLAPWAARLEPGVLRTPCSGKTGANLPALP